MDDLGLVSIITPTYNCAQYIGETIDTVISQTYINWEMIIVDDCSSDDTDKIVSKYQKRDSRIKYYRLANNSGAAVARTVAMRLASGKYIAFLDSDDLWMPNKLFVQLDFMIKNGYAFGIDDPNFSEILDKTLRNIDDIMDHWAIVRDTEKEQKERKEENMFDFWKYV